MDKFAVIGAGNAGYTMAAHLKQLDHEVRLYDIAEDQLTPVIENNNTITVTGNIDVTGDAKIDLVTTNLSEVIEDVKLIICVTPAHTHKFVAKDLASCLVSGQILLLHPGRTCGALEFRKVLFEQNCQKNVLIVEAQTLLYACRKEGSTVHVFGVKEKVPCAALPKEEGHRFFELIRPILPQFIPAPGIWNTSLENIGMLFHPTPTLLNLGRMESGHDFKYYTEGISPSIAYIIEKLDSERLKVAEEIGVNLPTALKWLEKSYGVIGKNLYEALQNNAAYEGIMAPAFSTIDDKKACRYVTEDVPTGLVPVSELGKKFGVNTPTINTIIDLANIFFDTDFRAKGRNLEQLGLDNMTLDEIRNL